MLVVFCASVLIVYAQTESVAIDYQTSQDIAAINEKIQGVNEQIEDLSSKADQLAQAIEEKRAEAQTLENELAIINNRIAKLELDIEKKESKLGNITGGLSGPAIKPIALLMTWKVYHKVKIPVIGMGGIMNWHDAIEFILCGASAVNIGTDNFVNPNAAAEIAQGIEKYLKEKRIKDIKSLVGSLRV